MYKKESTLEDIRNIHHQSTDYLRIVWGKVEGKIKDYRNPEKVNKKHLAWIEQIIKSTVIHDSEKCMFIKLVVAWYEGESETWIGLLEESAHQVHH